MSAQDIIVTTSQGVVPSPVQYMGILTATRFERWTGTPEAGYHASMYQTLADLDVSETVDLLRTKALEAGADAVIGVHFDMQQMKEGVLIIATGTAIRAQ